MEYFSEAVFKEFSPVSNNCFLHFLASDKNPYPLKSLVTTRMNKIFPYRACYG